MRRNRGEGGIEQIGKIWYFTYYDLRGRHVRKSSKSPLKSVAVEELRKAKEKLAKGIEPPDGKLKYEDIRELLVGDYRADGKVEEIDGELYISGKAGRLKPLDDYFKGMPVHFITTDVLREYREQRKTEGIGGPAINRNLAALRRMFVLARRENKVWTVPHFPMDAESVPRQGFLTPERFAKLRKAMPKILQPALVFLYTTGCRFGVVSEIQWDWISIKDRIVAIPSGVTKTDKPITLPLVAELVRALRRAPKDAPPFPVTNWKKAWIAACVATGEGRMTGESWWQYAGLTVHDFRRSAIRNMTQAGVSQTEAMSISGHKTVSVFQRYDIVDLKRKQAAIAKVEKWAAHS